MTWQRQRAWSVLLVFIIRPGFVPEEWRNLHLNTNVLPLLMWPLSHHGNLVSIWDDTLWSWFCKDWTTWRKTFTTWINIPLLIVIHYTHHLQPGIRGDDLVLFILTYHKADTRVGYLKSDEIKGSNNTHIYSYWSLKVSCTLCRGLEEIFLSNVLLLFNCYQLSTLLFVSC